MEIRQLITFQTIVELGSITKASEHLGYAQSSVTAQIQSLEDELNTPLFHRTGKRLRLSEAGERLLPYAKKLLQLHEEAKYQVPFPETPSGTLMIGSPESLAAFRLPPIIQEFRQLYPQVEIVLRAGSCGEIKEQAKKGELDVGFLLGAVDDDQDNLIVDELIQEKIVLVAATNHRLAEKQIVTVQDLQNESFLQTEAGCSYRNLLEQHLRKNGVHSSTGLEFYSIEAIKNCTAAGLGIAYLPYIAVERDWKEGKLAILPWEEASCQVMTKMVIHPKRWQSPALKEWLRLVKYHAKKWSPIAS
ncbi:LysR family transcriptional regulator [Risungbinella massiliensis]|uniref:LysR family transcriptional regulator n=1 Tax=Risungbinella massiliensis TaxID=1329796 RepID=UPI0005CC3A95|nr:LysR family transcriptional regulator [Risungbinella massiliensis]